MRNAHVYGVSFLHIGYSGSRSPKEPIVVGSRFCVTYSEHKQTKYQTIMKNKLLSCLLAIIASIGMINAEVYNGTCGGNLTWTLNTEDSTLTITGSGDMTNWTSENTPWYSMHDSFKRVIIGNGVTRIGNNAFNFCRRVTSIEIPNSVTSIGESAFSYIYDIQNIEIPNSVTNVGKYAFHNCTSLTNVSMSNNIISISDHMFGFCSNLTSVNIPNGVKSIEEGAFSRCSSLSSIEIPNSVTSIENTAFELCSSLTSIEIPNSVTSIGYNGAFQYCSNLTNVKLSNSLTRIATSTFAHCTSLQHIEIPGNITEITGAAFYNCTGLTSVTNHATTPQEIDNLCFYNVNKSSCVLYVPEESIEAYQADYYWNAFENILPISGTEVYEEDVNINYLNKTGGVINSEQVTLTLPAAPEIEGFTFLKWKVVESDLTDGINIQAVYAANSPTEAPAEVVNPKNPAQKLVRNGNVYILTEEKTYTVTGQKVK